MIPGPCVICGGTNYELSCGGPTICPKCDCGSFDASTVMSQTKVIGDLRQKLEWQADKISELDDERQRLRKTLNAIADTKVLAEPIVVLAAVISFAKREAEKIDHPQD